MKTTILAAALTLAALTTASAQTNGNVNANVNLNPQIIDAGRLQALRCRLGTVNPRACVQDQRQSPGQRQTAQRAPDRGGPRPQARR